MWVKICANTNLLDAQTAAELGANAVGFVLAPSKRQVVPEIISQIVDALPSDVEKVGVFTTDDPFEVEHFVACCGLTAAQLHRAYDAEMVRLLANEFGGEAKIIQAVAYDVGASDHRDADTHFAEELSAALDDRNVWALLIDAAKGRTSGGLGVSFDWEHVGELVRAANAQEKRVFLAGGLSSENVGEAIRAFKPWGVDVATGVEASPGKKDWTKLGAFISAAKEGSV